jgi:hypothetical protein
MAALAVSMAGCIIVTSPVSQGLFVTDVKAPLAVTGNAEAKKVGRSSCINVMGLGALGDASIEAAMLNGGITKIHHVDNRYFSVFFFFSKYTTEVYGD